MVDLGQKGGRNSTFLFLGQKKAVINYNHRFFVAFCFLYFSVAYLRETSDQLITLKNASM